jgi:hypothetical protein
MPVPEGYGMMRFDTPVPARSVKIHSRAALVVLQASRRHWQAGKKGEMRSSSVTYRVVANRQLGREEFVDVLPLVALW